MKRSEMLNILYTSIVTHMNCMCCESENDFADRVLSAIEESGMVMEGRNGHNGWDPEAEDAFIPFDPNRKSGAV